MIRSALVSTLFLAFAAAPAMGKQAKTDIPPVATPAGLASIFYVMDCMNQGFIDAGEVIEHGSVLFRRIDRDRSADISRAEYVGAIHKHWTPLRNAYFDHMDADGNDSVSLSDYMDHLAEMIDAADINRDGDASWEEILILRGEAVQQAGVPAAPLHTASGNLYKRLMGSRNTNQ